MISTVVLMNVKPDHINQVAEQLTDIEGISEVFSVAGRYDLVAIIRVKTNDEMAEVVTGKMLKIKGVIRSETLIAFRVFSKHDLASMFSIGMES
ncbi:MAG: Lrp/AsnC family transcriptional regulator [Chloroflexi bacterium]|nr:Lrp/AsnC family transcriptional regulator [Chloroflexota bacterium]